VYIETLELLMNQDKIELTLLPENRRIQIQKHHSILEALINAGILLRADCGGKGKCGKCRIQISDEYRDQASLSTEAENRSLGEKNLRAGLRLACQVSASGNIAIGIPTQTLLAAEVAQKGPTLLPALTSPRELAPGTPETFGIAVDLGTTTIAVYLCDLNRHRVKASVSMRNPQVIYGDDVMSRITAVYQQEDHLSKLQKMATNAIEWGVRSLCRSSGIASERLIKMVVVGNSTMIHLFAGEDPTSIGIYPYEPRFKEERSFWASELGFNFSDRIHITTLPLVSGFLGSDVVAAVLATDHKRWKDGTMLIDVGTNGEVVLLNQGRFSATSCATGPAFEGASIRHGMHAVSGAIDAVRIDARTGKATCSVIQKDPANPRQPSGICGSGVVSVIAELYKAGMISTDGRLLNDRFPGVFLCEDDEPPQYLLVAAEHTQANRAVTITQTDVRAIQLAKGALHTGIHLLCRETGILKPSSMLIAGAFGSYIDKQDALTIGLFPEMNLADLNIVGNAAGAGAILTLFDETYRQKALELAQSIHVIDLARHPDFQEVFMTSLSFPE
jgi:uncharacterized 2Fe-2S/4Fe-4S cluster protein (DUF4445 family)